jgi:DNA adenine methylase
MKYMGSKNRIAKEILPIMLEKRESRTWVEPFVGGGNMIDKVQGKRIGADNNKYLIDFWKAIQGGWMPPKHITKEEYYLIKDNKDNDPKMTLWAGICCSYGGKWFGGWISDYKEDRRLNNGRLPNHQTESRNGVLKQLPKIKDVHFIDCDYKNLQIPENSLIYCDPPYQGTTKYKDGFNHKEFWDWCRQKAKEGHIVFVSEYNAPNDFICVKEVRANTQLGNGSNSGNKVSTERLFLYCN